MTNNPCTPCKGILIIPSNERGTIIEEVSTNKPDQDLRLKLMLPFILLAMCGHVMITFAHSLYLGIITFCCGVIGFLITYYRR